MNTSANPLALAPSKLNAALDLAARGFWVFPVEANGKKPAVTGWQQWATCDAETVRRHWSDHPDHNIGIFTEKYRGGALLVGDVDVKNGKDGNQTLLLHELEGREILDTLAAATPSGGMHLFFSVSEAVRQGTDTLGRGLDVRSRGGYVLGAGSTIDGRPYRWLNDLPIAPAPQWALDGCGAPRERNAVQLQSAISQRDIDGAQVRRRIEQHIADHPPSIEGQGGHDVLCGFVRRAGDLGASLDLTLEAARRYNERAVPPWSDDELTVQVRSAYEGRESPVGCDHPLADFTVVSSPANDNGGGLKVESLSEVIGRTVAPCEDLIAGLIEKGAANFFAGNGGTNKSRLAFQMGNAIQSAAPLWGRATRNATFVYLSAEDDWQEVARRGQAIQRGTGNPNTPGSLFIDCQGFDTSLAAMDEGKDPIPSKFYRWLVERLNAVPGHKFVVLDSLYDFARFGARAKIDEHSVNLFVKRILAGLCRETDSTLLVVHHPSQAGIERGDGSGWSVAWHNAPRVRLSIKHNVERNTYTLKVEKRNHGTAGAEIELVYSDGAMVPLDARTTADIGPQLRTALLVEVERAARGGIPIRKQNRIDTAHIDAIEKATGKRFTDKEMKTELTNATLSGDVKFISGDKYRAAGFYPAAMADEFAKTAKLIGKNQAKTGQETRPNR